MKQHPIPRDNPPITEPMTSGACGTGAHALVGQRVVTAYDLSDSDRRETLLLLDNGSVLMLSCDPGYDDADRRTDDRWECCMYDATDTPAAPALRALEPGHWL